MAIAAPAADQAQDSTAQVVPDHGFASEALDDVRYGRELQAAWPTARLAVTRYLRRCGARDVDADDAAQESLVRAWARQIRFENADDLARWCCVVARNHWIDEGRRSRRVQLVPLTAAEHLLVDDVATAAEHRDLLDRALAGVAELTETQRIALLTSAPSGNRTLQTQNAVARHRARRRLLTIVGEGVAGVAALLAAMGRRLGPAATTSVAAAALIVLAPGGALPRATTAPDPAVAIHVTQSPERVPSHPSTRKTPPADERRVLTATDPSPSPGSRQGRAPLVNPKIRQRPKTANDHLICVDDASIGTICVDPPRGVVADRGTRGAFREGTKRIPALDA